MIFPSQSNHASQPSMLNRIPSMCNLTRANAAAVNSARLTLQNCTEAGHWSEILLTYLVTYLLASFLPYLFPLEGLTFTYISRCALIPLELATPLPSSQPGRLHWISLQHGAKWPHGQDAWGLKMPGSRQGTVCAV